MESGERGVQRHQVDIRSIKFGAPGRGARSCGSGRCSRGHVNVAGTAGDHPLGGQGSGKCSIILNTCACVSLRAFHTLIF